MRELGNKTVEEQKDLFARREELLTKRELLKLTLADNREELYFAKFGYIFGGLFTVSGFALWYFKIQRYQDRILKKEAAERK